jgi:hypothetical protein
MRRLSHTAKALVIGASVLAVCAAGAAQTTSNDPISIIPAESLFCVEINNLTGALGKVDQFLTGVSPMGVSMMVPAQLARVLGSADANGVNMAGNFALFGPLPGGDQPSFSRIAALIPVSNYDKFVKGNPKVSPPDAQGISAIGEAGQGFVAAKVSDYAMVTTAGNRQGLIDMKNLLAGSGATPLSKRLSPDELKQATSSPIWAYANMQAIDKIAEPILQKKIEEIKAAVQATPPPQGVPMMGQMDALANAYFTGIAGWMRQTQFVSLSLDPSASVIHASLVMMAVPDSEMSKILSMSNTGQQLKYLDYLENGAIMNLATTTSHAFVTAISEKYANLVAALMGPSAAAEDIAKIKQLVTDSMDTFSGTMAMSFSADLKAKPPFKVTYVAAITDKKKLSDLMDQAAKMMNEGAIAEFYKKLGMKMHFERKPNAETYQGVPIDAIHLSIQAVDVNSPEGQMLKNMYGSGVDLRLAVVNDLMLYTLSPEPDKAIHALIDHAKAATPGQVPSEVQAALQLLPDAKSADLFGTYNFLRLMQMAMAMMPMPLPPTDIATQSDVAFSGRIGGGKLQVGVAVPKQHVLEVMTTMMKMHQSQTPPPPGQPPQGQPQNRPQGQM